MLNFHNFPFKRNQASVVVFFEGLNTAIIADKTMYQAIIRASALVLKYRISATQPARKIYCIQLFFKFIFLNFNENMGTSETRKKQKTTINTRVIIPLSIRKLENEKPIPAQNKALAGVGMPINELVCRSSILNLARRKAEKTGTKNPANENQKGNALSVITEKINTPGATPKLITSANESSSFPIGE